MAYLEFYINTQRMLINFNLPLWVTWWKKKKIKIEGGSKKTLLNFAKCLG